MLGVLHCGLGGWLLLGSGVGDGWYCWYVVVGLLMRCVGSMFGFSCVTQRGG